MFWTRADLDWEMYGMNRQTSNYKALQENAGMRLRRRFGLYKPATDTLNKETAIMLGPLCHRRTLRYTRPDTYKTTGKIMLGRKWY